MLNEEVPESILHGLLFQSLSLSTGGTARTEFMLARMPIRELAFIYLNLIIHIPFGGLKPFTIGYITQDKQFWCDFNIVQV